MRPAPDAPLLLAVLHCPHRRLQAERQVPQVGGVLPLLERVGALAGHLHSG